MTDQEPGTELWTFGGSRMTHDGKRAHAWIASDGIEMLFKARGSFAVGSVYQARVTRNGEKITRHGDPVYSGRSDDETLRDTLSARHRAAEMALGVKARERADKRDDPMELAIERLGELAKNVPPSQRAAFAAYVAHRLGKFWE